MLTERKLRLSLYSIDPYLMTAGDREWFHYKANDLCKWNDADRMMAEKIIRTYSCPRRRKNRR